MSICIVLSFAAPAFVRADSAAVLRREVDTAPLLLVSGSRAEAEPLVRAFKDISRRDGGAFIDLREPAPVPPVAALELLRAVAAYQAFDYGRAMGHLQTAVQDAERSGAEGLSTEELCDIFIIRAMVKHGQGDATAAWQDFVQAAVIQPTRHLDAVRFSPSNVASFERAREAVSAGPRTMLTVNAPPACSIFVDALRRVAGQPEGLARGSHFVRVECPGRASIAQRLHLVAAEQRLDVAPPVSPTPTRDGLIALATERGFRHFAWAHVRTGSGRPATAILELVGTDKSSLARTSIALGEARNTRETAFVALDRLLDTLRPVPLTTTVIASPTPWYREPWFWATVGAVAGAAVILPFALQGDEPPGFGVSLGGQTP